MDKNRILKGDALARLVQSAKEEDFATVRQILGEAEALDLRDKRTLEAFFRAVTAEDPQLVEAFLDLGVPVNATVSGVNALSLAALEGAPAAVEFLLRRGADVNQRGRHGDTPLIATCRAADRMKVFGFLEEHLECVRLLLEGGADVDAANDQRMTALHYAAQAGAEPMVRLLVDAGAQVNVQDVAGLTPLHLVAVYGTSALCTFLASKGAQIDVADTSGATPLMLAAVHGNIEAVKELLRLGADPAKRDIEGKTAADLAGMQDRNEVVQLLKCSKPSPPKKRPSARKRSQGS